MRIEFPPFCLDVVSGRLRRGAQEVPLRPKIWAVLRYLAERPGRLVSKAELLDAVWPDIAVNEEMASGAVRELRRLLGDDSDPSKFIEIVRGRGFRFVAAQVIQGNDGGAEEIAAPHSLIGRNVEVGRLLRAWRDVLGGVRRFVFVTGEAGIGKTRLVGEFLAQAPRLAAAHQAQSAYVQCVEQHSVHEPFMPLLDVLAQLCRSAMGERMREVLREYAPAWLLQLPQAIDAAERQTLLRDWAGVSPERLLRMLVETLDVFSAECPLLIVLEDIHWSDLSTLDVLARSAHRHQSARLMVICTYRPVEASLRGLPLQRLKQDLLIHHRCEELALEYLDLADVSEFLAARYPGFESDQHLAVALLRRSGGNPLFLNLLLDDLEASGVLRRNNEGWLLAAGWEQRAIPESLRQTIEQQLERMSDDDLGLLEVASTLGIEFEASLLASVQGLTPDVAASQCNALARRRNVIEDCPATTSDAGSAHDRYRFVHPLYQEVLQARLTAARRRLLHQRIASSLADAANAAPPPQTAANIAWHFERGGDPLRAIDYHAQAIAAATQCYAYQQIIESAHAVLVRLADVPESRARDDREIATRLSLGSALIAVRGHAAPELRTNYESALTLCRRWGDSPYHLVALGALAVVRMAGAEVVAGVDLASQFEAMVERLDLPPMFRTAAYALVGQGLCYRGELGASRQRLEEAYRWASQAVPLQQAGAGLWVDPEVSTAVHLALVLAMQGYPAQAVNYAQGAIARARLTQHPYSLAFALVFSSHTFAGLRLWAQFAAAAREAVGIAAEHGFAYFSDHAAVLDAIAGAVASPSAGALHDLHTAVQHFEARRACLGVSNYLSILAESYGRAGRAAQGLEVIEHALEYAQRSGEMLMAPELHRLRGELLLANHGPSAHGERCLDQALSLSRDQGAKGWELRASVSLSRLWREQGKVDAAGALLNEVYGWFTEGFETEDLHAAGALLATLQAA